MTELFWFDVVWPKVAAYGGGEEGRDSPWRLQRLNVLIGMLASPTDDLISRISRLEDYKGVLHVFWKKEPRPGDRYRVDCTWEDRFGEVLSAHFGEPKPLE